jgi:hypothetical protein
MKNYVEGSLRKAKNILSPKRSVKTKKEAA